MNLSHQGTRDPGMATSDKTYVYDLRFEQVVQEGVGKVAVKGIFGNFLRQMQKHAPYPLDVYDVRGGKVDFLNPIPEDGFKERFAVEVQESPKIKKVILGFHLESATPLSVLKRNMFDFLQKHGMYVRPHPGGFDFGVKTTYLRYFGKENPATADLQDVVAKVHKSLRFFWSDDLQWSDIKRADFKKAHPNVIKNHGPEIPIVVTRAKHSAQLDSKTVSAEVLQVTVPSSYAQAAKKLMDGAFLSGALIPDTYVPQGLRREDPKLYYDLVREQAKWIYNHRNIPIQGVPSSQALILKKFLEAKKNDAVHRVYIDSKQDRINISTTAAEFNAVKTWLAVVLKEGEFTFEPKVIPTKGTGAQSSPPQTVYSKMFTQASKTSDGSFDSTIKTAQPNAWYKNRPVPLEIDFTSDADAFPPLHTKNASKGDSPTAASKISFSDETTIKTALASAVQDLEEQYEKKLQALSDRVTAKLQQLETAITRFEAMDTKLDTLLNRIVGPHYGSDHHARSFAPLASTPTRKPKRQDVKTTPRTKPGRQEVTPYQDEDDLSGMEYDYTHMPNNSSATSASEQEGPFN